MPSTNVSSDLLVSESTKKKTACVGHKCLLHAEASHLVNCNLLIAILTSSRQISSTESQREHPQRSASQTITVPILQCASRNKVTVVRGVRQLFHLPRVDAMSMLCTQNETCPSIIIILLINYGENTSYIVVVSAVGQRSRLLNGRRYIRVTLNHCQLGINLILKKKKNSTSCRWRYQTTNL